MDKSFPDVLTDELKSLLVSIRKETQEMFKGTRPFRQEKLSEGERIARYLSRPKEVDMLIQKYFPEEYRLSEMKMNDLIKKYGGDGGNP